MQTRKAAKSVTQPFYLTRATRATKTNPPPSSGNEKHADNVRYVSLLTTGFRRVPLSRTCAPGPAGLRFGQSKMNGRMWATNKTRRGRFHIRQTRTADTRRCQCNIRQYKYPLEDRHYSSLDCAGCCFSFCLDRSHTGIIAFLHVHGAPVGESSSVDNVTEFFLGGCVSGSSCLSGSLGTMDPLDCARWTLGFAQSKMNGRMLATIKTRRGRFHIRQTRTADERKGLRHVRNIKLYP